MLVPVVIYHNPKCGKSRQTLALLQGRGFEPRIIEYLKTPPEPAELRRLIDLLGLTPRQLLRSKEAAEAGLDDASLSDDQLIAGMSANPKTIERPIVVVGGRAVLGRPPEAVLAILPP
jgi:arsenate reductase (glutaredoxin)